MTGRRSRHAVRVVAAALMLALAGAAGAAGTSWSVTHGRPGDAMADRMQRVLAHQLDDAEIPGGAFAVVSGDTIEARGVGSAGSGRDVTAATPFVIGSATKSLTALAVMQLLDLRSQAEVARVSRPVGVTAIAFAADGRLAVGDEGNCVQFWVPPHPGRPRT